MGGSDMVGFHGFRGRKVRGGGAGFGGSISGFGGVGGSKSGDGDNKGISS